MSGLMTELKRRKVLRSAALYVAGAFAIHQASDILFPRLGLPDWTVTAVLVAGLMCFPVALVVAWVYEVDPEKGVRHTPPWHPADERTVHAWLDNRTAFMVIVLLALGAGLGAGWFLAPGSSHTGDERDVQAVVERLFDAMAAGDAEAASALMDPAGQLVSRRAGSGESETRAVSASAFAESLRQGERAFHERIWEPIVLVSGDIASLWAPYDFHVDGQFSHCGIDAFQLFRTATGWKIAGIAYSVEQDCEPSPLGPLEP